MFHFRTCETQIQCKDQCVCWVNVNCEEEEAATIESETEKPTEGVKEFPGDYQNGENAVRNFTLYLFINIKVIAHHGIQFVSIN